MNKIKHIILIAAILVIPAYASDPKYRDIKVKKVVSVYDGDTFRVNIKGYPDLIGKNIGIRIYGIDTPEIRSKDPKLKDLAVKARDFTRTKLLESQKIYLKNIKRGKYFRIIAIVIIDGEDLGELLIKNGLAKKYYGGKKPSWE